MHPQPLVLLATALLSSLQVSGASITDPSEIPTCAQGIGRCYRSLSSDVDAALEYCKDFTATPTHTSYSPLVTKCYGYKQNKPRQLNRRVSSACSCLETEATPTSDPDPDPSPDPDPTDPPAPGPTTTLLPAVPLQTDLADYDNLKPQDSNMLYYAEQSGVQNPYLKTQYVKMDANFTYPTVVLEYSKYVDSVTCDADGIDVMFNDVDAFQTVKNTWKDLNNLVIITFTEGCGESSDYTRTMWLVSDVSFETDGQNRWAECTAQEILTEYGLVEANLVWGTFTPGAPNPSNSLPGPPKLECADPPSDTIDGFPSAACGDAFDQALDEKIGYLPFSTDSLEDLAAFADSFSKFAPGLFGGFGQKVMRRETYAQLAKRGWFDDVIDTVGDVISDVGNGVADCLSDPVQCASDVGDAVADAAGTVWDALGDFLSYEGSIGLPFSFDIGLPGLSDSPWGPAFVLYKYESGEEKEAEEVTPDQQTGKTNSLGGGDTKSLVDRSLGPQKLRTLPAMSRRRDLSLRRRDDVELSGEFTLYCVDCGATGQTNVQGGAKISIANGVESLYVGMTGQMRAEVNLGISGEAKLTKTFKKILLTQGVDGFLAVPGVIAVGPILTLSSEFTMEAALSGNMLAGAALEMGPFEAKLDFASESNTYAKGFEPRFTKRFEVSAELSATAGFYIPVDLGIGVSIPPVDFKKTISIVEKPGIELEVKANLSYNGSDEEEGSEGDEEQGEDGGEEEDEDDDCENGVSWSLKVVNNIEIDMFDMYTIDVLKWDWPIAGQCYPFGGGDGGDDPGDDGTGGGDDGDGGSGGNGGTGNDPSTNPGASAISLIDDSAKYKVILPGSDASSNVFLSESQTPALWTAATDGVLVSDLASRFIQYHPDLMSKYGVSRFRLADIDHIPKSANMLLLRPVPLSNGKQVYVAFSTTGDLFYPVTCLVYNGAEQTMKMFVVKNTKKGLLALKDADLQWTVTGGVVQSCKYIPIKKGS